MVAFDNRKRRRKQQSVKKKKQPRIWGIKAVFVWEYTWDSLKCFFISNLIFVVGGNSHFQCKSSTPQQNISYFPCFAAFFCFFFVVALLGRIVCGKPRRCVYTKVCKAWMYLFITLMEYMKFSLGINYLEQTYIHPKECFWNAKAHIY